MLSFIVPSTKRDRRPRGAGLLGLLGLFEYELEAAAVTRGEPFLRFLHLRPKLPVFSWYFFASSFPLSCPCACARESSGQSFDRRLFGECDESFTPSLPASLLKYSSSSASSYFPETSESFESRLVPLIFELERECL